MIDFTEIPKANTGSGDQDTYEKFCRDFLHELGFSIIQEPSRGADGGMDLKVEEMRKGPFGITKIHWLVSCKHYAHSTKSITPQIEQDILDRVKSNHCQGFLGFYSTTVSTGLQKNWKS